MLSSLFVVTRLLRPVSFVVLSDEVKTPHLCLLSGIDTVKVCNHLSPNTIPGLEVRRASLHYGKGDRNTQHLEQKLENSVI